VRYSCGVPKIVSLTPNRATTRAKLEYMKAYSLRPEVKERKKRQRAALTDVEREAIRSYERERSVKRREEKKAYNLRPEVKERNRTKEANRGPRAYTAEQLAHNLAMRKRYAKSEAGRRAIAKYNASEKAKASRAASAHRRRADGGRVSAIDVAEVRKAHACYYCGVGVLLDVAKNHPRRLTIDHKVPVSRGGGSDRNNLVAACGACNVRKFTMTDEEFLRKIAA
jgi:5-methylcytosine-specific restriction endonuclease McrA